MRIRPFKIGQDIGQKFVPVFVAELVCSVGLARDHVTGVGKLVEGINYEMVY